MTLIIISISLAVLVAFFTCFSSWKYPGEERHKRNNRIAIVLLISAILTQGLTFYSGYTTNQEKKISDSLNVTKERENKILSDSLRVSQSKIIALQEDLLDTTKRILLTSLNSNILQKKINDIQTEFYKKYTGNNVRPHVSPMGYQPNFIGFVVTNDSRYAISDVHISMVDNFEVRRDFGALDINKIDPYAYGRDYNIGVADPGSAAIFYTRQIPQNWDFLFYHFYVYYRTGSYTWYVRYERNKKGEFRLTDSHYSDLRTGKEIRFPSPKPRKS